MASINNSINLRNAPLQALLRQSIAMTLAIGGFTISLAIVIADSQGNITPSTSDISIIALTACFISITRIIAGYAAARKSSVLSWAFGSGTAVLVAIWISMDPSSQQSLFVWTVLTGCELAWWNRWWSQPGTRFAKSLSTINTTSPESSLLVNDDWIVHNDDVADEDLQPWELEDTVQHWTRSRSADGLETIEAWMYAEFSEGQQYQSVHIAFIPQFAQEPTLTTNQLDGPNATIKVGETRIYGARLECKLDTPAIEYTQVMIHITAHGVVNKNSHAA